MGGELERRWDDAVETAWRELRQRLADRLAELELHGSITVTAMGTDAPEDSPYCRVTRFEELIEVDVADGAGRGLLLDHVPVREVDRAAVLVVESLRDVLGVVHPAWLVGEGFDPVAAAEPFPPEPPRGPHPDEVVRPRSVEEVRAVVEAAVRELYDELPGWDDDGDLPLPAETCVVWVSVSTTSPRVLLHSVLAEEVADERIALVEVNLLNQQEFGLAFILRDGRVTVTREIGLDAVTPAALEAEVGRLLGQVDQWARELRQRLRAGELRPVPSRRQGRWSTAYAVMVELEKAERGSLGPAALARTFDDDTGMLLRALRVTEQKRRELRAEEREARKLGKHRRESMLRARQDYLRGLATRLRAALRLLVDAPVRKTQLDQLSLFGEDECGTTRDP